MNDLRKAAEALLNHWEAGEYKNCTGYMAGHVATLRQALDDKPPVKTYAGGKPNYCTPEQEPSANKYNGKRIAWELERTALGDGYFGNALYVAMDMPQTTKADKEMLHRYMCGSNLKTDHIKLQDLAMRIYTAPVDAVNMSQERVDETAKDEHEPLCYLRDDIDRPFGGFEHCDKDDAGAFPVYLAPPKKEWVGLSDEEKKNWKALGLVGVEIVAAHLKEKNA